MASSVEDSTAGHKISLSMPVVKSALPQRLKLGQECNVDSNKSLTSPSESFSTVEDVVELLKNSKRIIVLTGAGISTSLGIPDFRSFGGLYDSVSDDFAEPQELFEGSSFRADPSLFFRCLASIIPSDNSNVFSMTHAFVRELQEKERLLTQYTQNIDCFELNAGMKATNLIHCHGSLSQATCLTCQKVYERRDFWPTMRKGQIPYCKDSACQRLQDKVRREKRKERKSRAKKRKRKDFEDDEESDDDPDIACLGVLKPNIAFFHEHCPDLDKYRTRLHADADDADLILVIGTSLEAAPVNTLPFAIPKVPLIYINRESWTFKNTLRIQFDIELIGECDIIVSELSRRLGWELNHTDAKLAPDIVIEPLFIDKGHIWRFSRLVKQDAAKQSQLLIPPGRNTQVIKPALTEVCKEYQGPQLQRKSKNLFGSAADAAIRLGIRDENAVAGNKWQQASSRSTDVNRSDDDYDDRT